MHLLRSMCLVFGLAGLAGVQPASAGGTEWMEYDITWVGISVGTMTIHGGTNEAGHVVRTLRLWNRPWIALVYPVETTVECTIEPMANGPRHVVAKKVREHKFHQDDTLVLWPEQGRARWSNALEKTSRRFAVPKGSRDLVTFFFDLRDVLAGSPLSAGGRYQLVMDGAIHDLDIEIGEPKKIRTDFGRLEAIPVAAESHSPTLFARNRPKSVWVATAKPAVLFADVESRFGPVRATLVRWEIDGKPVEWNPPAAP